MGRGVPFSLELHDYACGRLIWTHVEEAYTYIWLITSVTVIKYTVFVRFYLLTCLLLWDYMARIHRPPHMIQAAQLSNTPCTNSSPFLTGSRKRL